MSGVGTPTVELPAYVPGELIDVASADLAPPTRGIRPRRRSRLQRALIFLTSGTALLVLGGLLALATALSPFGAQRESRAAAERELRSELEDGERVLARAYVSQRNWWDNFRESFGLLAATDRRLIFVGLPPVSWIRREDDDGPPELRVQSFSFDAPFTAEPHRLLLWTSPGVVVQTTSGDVAFLVARGEGPHVRQIDSLVSRARVAQSQAIEREQIGFRAPPPPPTVYVSHVVRSGESVTSIARRYHTTPDVIRQLNRLPNDRIRIGQRLRVPQTPAGADSAAAAVARPPQPANIP
ncbi:MAG: LysM peptidoglycan-binding domain-containing protein [Gemmatirosa sp.]|nr:LysM peptidoglycan-binding domain-containing protein [Gemmatirosa sp.]